MFLARLLRLGRRSLRRKTTNIFLTIFLLTLTWVQMDSYGYVWELHDKRARYTQVVARCSYSFMRISGIERWRGIYFNKSMDFSGNGLDDRFVDNSDLDGLCGCVEWVYHFLFGDLYI